MLFCLLDGHARTSTELAIVAEVSPSTASVHLSMLRKRHLVRVQAQGRHRYYSLDSAQVAAALESLSVLAGDSRVGFAPNTPIRLRVARTCYDHMAGAVAVAVHDRFVQRGWIVRVAGEADAYELSGYAAGVLAELGVNTAELRTLRRRFAYPCLDWSERRPHLAGAVGAALLQVALKRKWVARHLDSRALRVTAFGRRELRARFGVET